MNGRIRGRLVSWGPLVMHMRPIYGVFHPYPPVPFKANARRYGR